MSRSRIRYGGYARNTYLGRNWICDVCGEEESPGGFMAEPFQDGRHICKKCLTKHIVDYFGHDYWPEIIHVEGSAYVIHCFEFKQRRKPRVPSKLRKEILSAGKCNHCGAKENLQVDHIIPTSKGGANVKENMQCFCGSCNSRKGNKIEHDDLRRILPEGSLHKG